MRIDLVVTLSLLGVLGIFWLYYALNSASYVKPGHLKIFLTPLWMIMPEKFGVLGNSYRKKALATAGLMLVIALGYQLLQ